MKIESEEDKQALETLCDVAQQAWDKGSYSRGEWPALEKALLLIDPMVHPGFDIKDFLGYEE
jgi:hypothetical protein